MTEKFQTYILIETAVDHTLTIQEKLSKIKDIKTVNIITGSFDIIALLEADDAQRIGEIILKEIRPIPGIIHTLTCVVVG